MTMGTMGLSSLLYMAAGAWVAVRLEPSETVIVHDRPASRRGRRCSSPTWWWPPSASRSASRSRTCCWATRYPVRFELVNVIVPTLIQTP